MVSAQARREAVLYAVERGLSQRRACALLSVARSALGYESRREKPDRQMTRRLRVIALRHPRYGYRRAWAVLRRKGHEVNPKRVHRLWRGAGLSLARRRPRKRVRVQGLRPVPATGANHVWAYDFVHDACANGQKLKMLTVLDEYTRYCLTIEVEGRMHSGKVVEVLARLMSQYGVPRSLRSDNGPEFIAAAVKRWLEESAVGAAYIDPGKPWQNGANESFNGKFRDECLSRRWFLNRADARAQIAAWREEYNRARPHSSLKYRTPEEVWQEQTDPPHARERRKVGL
jgi:putative transposase